MNVTNQEVSDLYSLYESCVITSHNKTVQDVGHRTNTYTHINIAHVDHMGIPEVRYRAVVTEANNGSLEGTIEGGKTIRVIPLQEGYTVCFINEAGEKIYEFESTENLIDVFEREITLTDRRT